MDTTPKSLRLQIALFGRTNVGKSSFLNLISGQDVAITSARPGTTTDVVEKAMELLPIGPVVFLDTAGIDDQTELGELRIRKSRKVFDRADIVVILCEAGNWGEAEENLLAEANARKTPVVVVINKCDVRTPDPEFLERLKQDGIRSIVTVSSIRKEQRERFLADFKRALIENCPDDFLTPPPLLGDLIRPGDLVVLIVPIDLQAPKGRLILPQVQTIRDVLDHDAAVLTVKENEYLPVLNRLKTPPALVVCDSQVVRKMVDETPAGIPCTTFSILFSRLKGDMRLMAEGTAAIDSLRKGDKVLIAEACTHHATQDDIGRVKIPRWLKNYLGDGVEIDVYAGRDYPENFSDYKLAIHCGGCMLNRREVLSRLQMAAKAGVPVTNYGMCISLLQGVLDRVLSPFPAALTAFRNERERLQKK